MPVISVLRSLREEHQKCDELPSKTPSQKQKQTKKKKKIKDSEDFSVSQVQASGPEFRTHAKARHGGMHL